jgi:hypothetical protein
MGKESKSTASLEGAVETTTNEVVAENLEVIADEGIAGEGIASEGELTEVRFLVSPTGTFGLAYSEGETGFFPLNQAAELVESKYAEFVK